MAKSIRRDPLWSGTDKAQLSLSALRLSNAPADADSVSVRRQVGDMAGETTASIVPRDTMLSRITNHETI